MFTARWLNIEWREIHLVDHQNAVLLTNQNRSQNWPMKSRNDDVILKIANMSVHVQSELTNEIAERWRHSQNEALF